MSGSDHYMVSTKMVFLFEFNKGNRVNEESGQTEVKATEQYNLDSLINESTRNLYQHRLDTMLLDNIESQSVKEVYGNITSSIKAVAVKAFGLKSNSAKCLRYLNTKQKRDR